MHISVLLQRDVTLKADTYLLIPLYFMTNTSVGLLALVITLQHNNYILLLIYRQPYCSPLIVSRARPFFLNARLRRALRKKGLARETTPLI